MASPAQMASDCARFAATQPARSSTDPLLTVLALPARGTADTAYLVQQVTMRARQAPSCREEVDPLLHDLPPSGLGLRQPWGLHSLAVLSAACREPRDVTTAGTCPRGCECRP